MEGRFLIKGFIKGSYTELTVPDPMVVVQGRARHRPLMDQTSVCTGGRGETSWIKKLINYCLKAQNKVFLSIQGYRRNTATPFLCIT